MGLARTDDWVAGCLWQSERVWSGVVSGQDTLPRHVVSVKSQQCSLHTTHKRHKELSGNKRALPGGRDLVHMGCNGSRPACRMLVNGGYLYAARQRTTFKSHGMAPEISAAGACYDDRPQCQCCITEGGPKSKPDWGCSDCQGWEHHPTSTTSQSTLLLCKNGVKLPTYCTRRPRQQPTRQGGAPLASCQRHELMGQI